MIRRYCMTEQIDSGNRTIVVAPIFKLWTTDYKYFDILPNGDIVRLDQSDFRPSGQWKIVGITPNKGPIIPFDDLTADFVSTLKWQLKNGKARYSVVDYDHGTRRMWGNGISGIYFYKENERNK